MAPPQFRAPEQEVRKVGLHAVLWNSLGAGSIAYALTELLNNLPADRFDRKLWCLRADPTAPHEYDRPVFAYNLYRAFAKMAVPAVVQGRLGRRRMLSHVNPGDVVYLWPPYDSRLIRGAQKRGAVVIAERTNCMPELGRHALRRAYARRGMPLPKGWFAPAEMVQERKRMLECDYVTAPNAIVAQSLKDEGVPDHRIIETCYGFDPERLKAAIGIRRPDRPPVFAFVGLGIVRKGLDVLLEAWEAANATGKLLLAGRIEDDIRKSYHHILSRSDVEELGYVDDIAKVYAAADVFVFPSHEEGGPQVIYEAAGSGLPSIVSQMGAGRIIRDQHEGLIIDPLDVNALADAITELAQNSVLRGRLAAVATESAQEFTWSKVGGRLCDQLISIADVHSSGLVR